MQLLHLLSRQGSSHLTESVANATFRSGKFKGKYIMYIRIRTHMYNGLPSQLVYTYERNTLILIKYNEKICEKNT